MADLSSFDVVSRVDMQELKNALDQTMKEVRQRFDFKGTKTDLTLKEKEKQLVVVSDDEYKLKAVLEILKAKCVKRGVSLKALTYGSLEEALDAMERDHEFLLRGDVFTKDAIAEWLVALHDSYGVDVETASITPTREPGFVNATFLLRRP